MERMTESIQDRDVWLMEYITSLNEIAQNINAHLIMKDEVRRLHREPVELLHILRIHPIRAKMLMDISELQSKWSEYMNDPVESYKKPRR